jgi:hypothetical protein
MSKRKNEKKAEERDHADGNSDNHPKKDAENTEMWSQGWKEERKKSFQRKRQKKDRAS